MRGILPSHLRSCLPCILGRQRSLSYASRRVQCVTPLRSGAGRFRSRLTRVLKRVDPVSKRVSGWESGRNIYGLERLRVFYAICYTMYSYLWYVVAFWLSVLPHAGVIHVQDRSRIMSLPTFKSHTLGGPALVGVGFGDEDAATCKWPLPAHFVCWLRYIH